MYHRNSELGFALVSRNETGTLIQATGTFTCRDYLHDCIQAQLHGRDTNGGGCGYNPREEPPIVLDEFRLLIFSHKEDLDFRFRLHTAKRILNAYEEVAKFPTRLKLTAVKHEAKHSRGVWLMTGDQRWISHAQLMSMITLIVRCCALRFSDLPAEPILNIEQAEAYLRGCLRSSSHTDVIHYLPQALKIMRPMMENFDNIFTLPLEKAYPARPNVSWHSGGGIVALAKCNTGIDHLNNKIRKLKKKPSSCAKAE